MATAGNVEHDPPLSHWGFPHQCEGFAVSASDQSQALDIFRFSRLLVADTHRAALWLSDRFEIMALLLDGPIQEQALLWLDSTDSQQSTYSKLLSSTG